MGELQLVNFEQIEVLGGTAASGVKEILVDFLILFEKRLPELDDLLGKGANLQLREEAHKLKGAARSCGFDALGLHAEILEDAAEADNLSGFGEWSAQANGLLEATKAELDSREARVTPGVREAGRGDEGSRR